MLGERALAREAICRYIVQQRCEMLGAVQRRVHRLPDLWKTHHLSGMLRRQPRSRRSKLQCNATSFPCLPRQAQGRKILVPGFLEIEAPQFS